MKRISVVDIILGHLMTLYDNSAGEGIPNKKIRQLDIIIFFVLPLFLSLTLVYLKVFVSSDYLDTLLTILSIFVGLLFGLLPLVFQLSNELSSKLNDRQLNSITNNALLEIIIPKIEKQEVDFNEKELKGESISEAEKIIYNQLKNKLEEIKQTDSSLSIDPDIIKIRFNINKELFVNICFAILMAIFSMISLLLSQISYDIKCISVWQMAWMNGIHILTYLLLLIFFFTLLMILRRFYLLYSNNFS